MKTRKATMGMKAEEKLEGKRLPVTLAKRGLGRTMSIMMTATMAPTTMRTSHRAER